MRLTSCAATVAALALSVHAWSQDARASGTPPVDAASRSEPTLAADEARIRSFRAIQEQLLSMESTLQIIERIARNPEAARILLASDAVGRDNIDVIGMALEAVARTGLDDGDETKVDLRSRIEALEVRLAALPPASATVDMTGHGAPASETENRGADVRRDGDPLKLDVEVLGYVGGRSPRVSLRIADGAPRVVYLDVPFEAEEQRYRWVRARSLGAETDGRADVRLTFVNEDTGTEILHDWRG